MLRPDEAAKLTSEMPLSDPYTEPVPLIVLTHVMDITVITFNVHRGLDQAYYTLEPGKLGLPKDSILVGISAMAMHEGEVEGVREEGLNGYFQAAN